MGVAAFEKTAFEATAFEMVRDYVAPASGVNLAVTGAAAGVHIDRYAGLSGTSVVTTGNDANPLVGYYAGLLPTVVTSTGYDVSARTSRYAQLSSINVTSTGNDAVPFVGYYSGLSGASFTSSGYDAVTRAGRYAFLDSVSIALAGVNAPTRADRYAGLSNIDIITTGNNSLPRADRRITESGGSYLFTVFDATTLTARSAILLHGSTICAGQDARVARDLFLPSNDNTFTVSWGATSAKADRRLGLDLGYFNTTGWSVSVPFGRNLRMYPGTYTQAGQETAFKATRMFSPAKGNFGWTVGGRGPYAGRYLAALHAEAGSFEPTAFYMDAFQGITVLPHQMFGKDATLRRGLLLTTAAGAHNSTGNAARAYYGRAISAFGSYSSVGFASQLKAVRYFAQLRIPYALVGKAASLRFDRPMRASPGVFTFSGRDLRFVEAFWIYPDIEVISVPWELQSMSIKIEDRWVIAPEEDRAVYTDMVETMPTRARRRVA